MASDTDDIDITEFTAKNEENKPSGVDKKKEMDILLIQIKGRKRTAKTKVTKLRHDLERLCVKESEVTVIESAIEQLWAALENAQQILEKLSAFYVEVGDDSGKNEAFKESETIEKEVQKVIEAGQDAIKVRAAKTVNINRPSSENTTDRYEQPAQQYQLNKSHDNHDDRNRILKPFQKSSGRVNRDSEFENGKAATMPHRERLGSHPQSRSHCSRIRGGQRDIKNEVWWCATSSANLHGSTRTNANHYK